jgi:hypothetical protein
MEYIDIITKNYNIRIKTSISNKRLYKILYFIIIIIIISISIPIIVIISTAGDADHIFSTRVYYIQIFIFLFIYKDIIKNINPISKQHQLKNL